MKTEQRKAQRKASTRAPLGTPRRIREARIAKGWSQEVLAKRIGVHQVTVSALERGAKSARPYAEPLNNALGLQLFNGRPSEPAPKRGRNVDEARMQERRPAPPPVQGHSTIPPDRMAELCRWACGLRRDERIFVADFLDCIGPDEYTPPKEDPFA